MKKNESRVLEPSNDLTEITTIYGYKARLIAAKYSNKYVMQFSCNENGDFNTEAVYTFEKPDDYTVKMLDLLFEESPFILIYDREKNIELEIGISSEPKLQIYFELNDFEYDASSNSYPITYKIMLDNRDINFQKFDLLIGLINKNMKKEEKESHEYQSYTVKHTR